MQKVLRLPTGDIPYLLKASPRRRTVSMRINQDGLTVSIPSRMNLKLLDSLLQERASWITAKLTEWQDNRQEKIAFNHGTCLRHLGQDIQLHVIESDRNRLPQFDGQTLTIALPDPDNTAQVQRKVIQWYRKQALADFVRRVELMAARLGVPTPPVILSSAKTRWGSCNSRGEIRLNWRLIQAPPAIIFYVVAHELAHLKEMNHSPKFWAWVERIYPDYKTYRIALKLTSSELTLI